MILKAGGYRSVVGGARLNAPLDDANRARGDRRREILGATPTQVTLVGVQLADRWAALCNTSGEGRAGGGGGGEGNAQKGSISNEAKVAKCLSQSLPVRFTTFLTSCADILTVDGQEHRQQMVTIMQAQRLLRNQLLAE